MCGQWILKLTTYYFRLLIETDIYSFFTSKKLLVASMGFRIYVNTINAGDFH